MAEAARRHPRLTAREYLDIERDAVTKHEFVDGLVYAMAGTTRRHNAIATELFSLTNAHLVDSRCEAFALEAKVHLEQGDDDCYFYPDVFVTCAQNDTDELSSNQPVLIIEVASPSTKDYDAEEKFRLYRQFASLQEYGLLAQDEKLLKLFRRRAGWKEETYGAGDAVTFEAISLTLSVEQIYRRARLPV